MKAITLKKSKDDANASKDVVFSIPMFFLHNTTKEFKHFNGLISQSILLESGLLVVIHSSIFQRQL